MLICARYLAQTVSQCWQSVVTGIRVPPSFEFPEHWALVFCVPLQIPQPSLQNTIYTKLGEPKSLWQHKLKNKPFLEQEQLSEHVCQCLWYNLDIYESFANYQTFIHCKVNTVYIFCSVWLKLVYFVLAITFRSLNNQSYRFLFS